MNKETYIEELKIILTGKPTEEIESAIIYVEEFFDEVMDDQMVIAQLGSPQKFAESIFGEGNLFNKEKAEKKKQSNKNLLIIVLGILSAPISIPLLLTVAALVLTLIILAFSALIVVLSGGFAGTVLLVSSIRVFTGYPQHALTLVFAGIALIGFSLMLTVTLFKGFTRIMEGLSRKVNSKVRKGKLNEETI